MPALRYRSHRWSRTRCTRRRCSSRRTSRVARRCGCSRPPASCCRQGCRLCQVLRRRAHRCRPHRPSLQVEHQPTSGWHRLRCCHRRQFLLGPGVGSGCVHDGRILSGTALVRLGKQVAPKRQTRHRQNCDLYKRIGVSDQGRRKERCKHDSACDEDLTGPERWLVNVSPGPIEGPSLGCPCHLCHASVGVGNLSLTVAETVGTLASCSRTTSSGCRDRRTWWG